MGNNGGGNDFSFLSPPRISSDTRASLGASKESSPQILYWVSLANGIFSFAVIFRLLPSTLTRCLPLRFKCQHPPPARSFSFSFTLFVVYLSPFHLFLPRRPSSSPLPSCCCSSCLTSTPPTIPTIPPASFACLAYPRLPRDPAFCSILLALVPLSVVFNYSSAKGFELLSLLLPVWESLL